MSNLFSTVLNMSMTGSVVILLVILVRLILKRAPKIFSYALWSVALFRLLCPVAFMAPISVLDVVEPKQRETSNNTSIVTYIPASVDTQTDFIAVQPDEQPVQTEIASKPEDQYRMTPMHAAAMVWGTGMVGMILYSIMQFLRLRSRLVGAVQLMGNIYLSDYIDTAFVVGLLQPRIYLPSAVTSEERYYILAHEQHHIRRGDHIIKLLAYMALCIHWFNPLVWMAFVFSGKDMEMSCDEAVIKQLGVEIRADYSASLLRLATHKKILSGMPLAFGEGDTKGRVLNMAKWKKPTRWLVMIGTVLCLIVILICVFNPEKREILSIEEATWHTSDGPVSTGIGDLCFTYPGGLTSEQRDVDNWTAEDTANSMGKKPSRRPYNNWFIDNGVDFGGVVDFIVPDDREINLEEMNLPTEWQGLDYIAGSSTYPYAEMEYTLLKDGKDYIQMYLYTYSGRGYFLWFYTEQGNPAHKEAILNSVELGSYITNATELKRDEIVSLGQFNVTIPKGYGYHRNEAKILEITKKDRFNNQTLLGCVTAIPNPNLPMDTDEDRVKWVEAIGIDLSYNGKSYAYSITDENKYGDIFVNREELMHGNSVMAENHYIYIVGDIVYDFCINALEIDSANERMLLDSVWIKEFASIPNAVVQQPEAGVNGSDIVMDMELVQYGALNFVLPSKLTAMEENGSILLTIEAETVGGITLRHSKQPNTLGTFSQEWQSAMGVPEASDPAMGYMSGGSIYADYEVTYFPDIPVNRDENGNIIPDEQGTYVLENEVTHYFFGYGTDVYDIWFYNNRLPNTIREQMLKTCFIEGVTDITVIQNSLKEENDALTQCRNVLMQIQSNDACRIETKQENGSFALNATTIRTDWIHGNDRLHICVIPESGGSSTFGALLVNGVGYECDAVRDWFEITNWEWTDPWLYSFQWDDSVVAYMDSLTDENGTTVMLRIDQPFAEGENQQPHYFVNFNFDADGAFRSAYVQTNLFMNNELSKTETVVSLDSELVSSEIQKEYQRAMG